MCTHIERNTSSNHEGEEGMHSCKIRLETLERPMCLFHETRGGNELSRAVGYPQQKYHLGCFKCTIKELK